MAKRAPKKLTAAEAIDVLLREAMDHKLSEENSEALSVIIDHVTRLEQALNILQMSHQGVTNTRPPNAVLGVQRKYFLSDLRQEKKHGQDR